MANFWQLSHTHTHSFGTAALPAGHRSSCRCIQVTATAAPASELGKESRIGKQVVPLPKGATFSFDGSSFRVKGPKGEMAKDFDGELVEITQEGDRIRIYKKVESRRANETHGLVRALLASMVEGVTTGFTKTMTLIGVGYRASTSGKELTMNLGYSHPIVMDIPDGLTVEVEKLITVHVRGYDKEQVEKLTTVHVRGYDKEQVGQFAASLRAKRPPEPYKGKGVRYVDEFVRKKEGKRGKK